MPLLSACDGSASTLHGILVFAGHDLTSARGRLRYSWPPFTTHLLSNRDGAADSCVCLFHQVSRDAQGNSILKALEGGKYQCNICKDKPSVQAGKASSGAIVHLASKAHYLSWLKDTKGLSFSSETEKQDAFNLFAHNTVKAP